MKRKIIILTAIITALFTLSIHSSLAQTPSPNPMPPEKANMLTRLSTIGGLSGYNINPDTASTPVVVGLIVKAFIGFLGLTFIVLMVIAGYGWMTAGGNDDKIKKSLDTIKNSIIGLVVALSAWILWNFIFEKLIK